MASLFGQSDYKRTTRAWLGYSLSFSKEGIGLVSKAFKQVNTSNSDKVLDFICLSINRPTCMLAKLVRSTIVDAPGCGTFVVRGPTGHSKEDLIKETIL